MTKVLQVCGVTIPSAADAWVYKEFTSVPLTDPTGIYVSTEFRWPAGTLAAWNADESVPLFFSAGNQGAPWSVGSGLAWDTPSNKWRSDGTVIVVGDDAADTYHTLDLHFHDLTVDGRVDGSSVVTHIADLPEVAGQFWGGATSPFGTTAVEKVASPFTLGNNGLPLPPASVLNAITLTHLAKNGSPSDNLVVQVCADAGGSPGTVLDTSTQPFSAGPAFFFTGGVTLNLGTTYWVVVSRSGGLDNTNNYTIGTDPFSGQATYWDGAAWQSGVGVAFLAFTQWLGLNWGALFTDPVQNKLWIRQINVGTSGFGSSNLFSEDWSGGSPLGDFDAHSGDLVVVPEPGSAPFALGATPVALSLAIPDSGHLTIFSTLLTGSPESISLSIIESLPTGVAAVFAPTTISDDGGASTLTFTIDNTASAGIVHLTVEGDDGAGGVATTPITLYLATAPAGVVHIAS